MSTLRWTTSMALAGVVALAGCADTYDEGEELGAEDEVGLEETEPADGLDYGYSEWDVNTDRALGRDEFGTWAGEQGWAEMDEEGFSETTVGLWDVDDDDRVSEQEWTDATDRWYGDDVEYGTWADWDGDGDSFLDANEVREGMETNNLYDRVDMDNDAVFDDEELADWWFDVWDFNDDETIDTTEWDWSAQYGYDRIGS